MPDFRIPRPRHLIVAAAAFLVSTTALADVAPGCSSQTVTSGGVLAAGVLAVGIGVFVLLLPRRR